MWCTVPSLVPRGYDSLFTDADPVEAGSAGKFEAGHSSSPFTNCAFSEVIKTPGRQADANFGTKGTMAPLESLTYETPYGVGFICREERRSEEKMLRDSFKKIG